MHRLGFLTLIVAGGLIVASAMIPHLTPREAGGTRSARALILEEIDVLFRVGVGEAPRMQREGLEVRFARLREYAGELGDESLKGMVAGLPKNASPQDAETLTALARIWARAHALQGEQDRLRAAKVERASALLFWPGLALLAVGLGLTYGGFRRMVVERRRLQPLIPGVEDELAARALRLVESHRQAHEQLIEASREKRDLLAENKVLEDFKVYDQLTRLLRDDACIERATPLVGEYLYRGAPYFVALMDLDLFKRINDTYGHPTGDDALRHYARALTAAAGDTVFVSRKNAGGDEFIAIGSGGDREFLAFRDRLLEHLRTHRYRLPGVDEPYVIGTTMGYTLPTPEIMGDLRDGDTAKGRAYVLLKQLKHCDGALYEAKHAARGSVRKYSPEGSGAESEKPLENPALDVFLRIERHIRTDLPHKPTHVQAPVVEALERAAEALDAALRHADRPISAAASASEKNEGAPPNFIFSVDGEDE